MIQETSLKELVEEELESAQERIEAAEILLERDKLVDAVNRMYYGVFHAARAVLNSLGREAKTHSGLISEFGLHVVKPGLMKKKFARILRRSFESRETGNYVIGAEFGKKEVESMLNDAQLFIQEAERLTTERLKKY